jgi:hypothetical protein
MIPLDALRLDSFTIKIPDPFLVFETRDVLDEAEYQALRQEFPAKAVFPGIYADKGNKRFLSNFSPDFFEVLENAPSWRALYSRLCDPDVVTALWQVANSAPSNRPASQRMPWRIAWDPNKVAPKKKGLSNLRKRLAGRLSSYTPVRIGFEFSYLENGCFVPPHTDDVSKLISLMLYFPDEHLDYGSSAGTEFYRGRMGKPTRAAWKVNMLDAKDAAQFYSEHETFYSSDFLGRKLIGFVKSDVSWHGLRQLVIPTGATRRSVNINYYAI